MTYISYVDDHQSWYSKKNNWYEFWIGLKSHLDIFYDWENNGEKIKGSRWSLHTEGKIVYTPDKLMPMYTCFFTQSHRAPPNVRYRTMLYYIGPKRDSNKGEAILPRIHTVPPKLSHENSHAPGAPVRYSWWSRVLLRKKRGEIHL